jgi:hypothetical protein
MPNDNPAPNRTEAERQAHALAALIDAAGDDLARHGPVSPAELRRRLEALEAEWEESLPDHQTRHAGDARPRG